MAIHNGNTDFDLVAYQNPMNGKGIFIKFNYSSDSNGINPISISVSGGRGAYRKSYNIQDYQAGTDWYTFLEVPQYGSYRVHISTNRGYSYDYKNVNVGLQTPAHTPRYTFTKEDVRKHELEGLIVALAFIGVGLVKRLAWPIALFSAGLSITGYFADTDFETEISIIEGWSIESTLTQISDTAIQEEIRQYDKQNNLQKTITRVFPIFPPV